jgi:hypothetical protein
MANFILEISSVIGLLLSSYYLVVIIISIFPLTLFTVFIPEEKFFETNIQISPLLLKYENYHGYIKIFLVTK